MVLFPIKSFLKYTSVINWPALKDSRTQHILGKFLPAYFRYQIRQCITRIGQLIKASTPIVYPTIAMTKSNYNNLIVRKSRAEIKLWAPGLSACNWCFFTDIPLLLYCCSLETMKSWLLVLLICVALLHKANAFGNFGKKSREHLFRQEKAARQEGVKNQERSSLPRFLTKKTQR